jgi:hypothetical protein
MKNKVITLALAAANTLSLAYQASSIPKIVAKNIYHVHKAIEGYMLERFKQMSMWSDGGQMVARFPSDLRQTTLHAHFKLISFLFQA